MGFLVYPEKWMSASTKSYLRIRQFQDYSPLPSVTSTSRYRTKIFRQTNWGEVDCWGECGKFLPLPPEAEAQNQVVAVQRGQKSDSAAETTGCHWLEEWLWRERTGDRKNLWPMTASTKPGMESHRRRHQHKTSAFQVPVMAMTQK